MSDIVDMASGIEAEILASRLARIDPVIPAGVAGECEDCGEQMPRLVDGRCGFCRNGRTPPASFYDRPAPVAIPSAPILETPMQVHNRKITIEGAALAAIERRADAGDISFKQATEELIVEGATRDDSDVDLALIDNATLLGELSMRLAAAIEIDTDALDAMTTRATAAEAKVAAMKAALLD